MEWESQWVTKVSGLSFFVWEFLAGARVCPIGVQSYPVYPSPSHLCAFVVRVFKYNVWPLLCP
eukprot:549196-Rhodomonas_salina.2